jgi:hypothetical protein
MRTANPTTLRRVVLAVVALVSVAALVIAVRQWLPGYAVRTVLGMAGATDVRFARAGGTPWRLEVSGLAFRVQGQEIRARRVALDREHWWTASLGDVRVEGVEMLVVLDGSDAELGDWQAYGDAALADEPVTLPLRHLDLDGHFIVRVAGQPERPVAVVLTGRPLSDTSWTGSLAAEGEGFRLAGTGSLLRAGQELEFQVQGAELDLGQWSPAIQRLVVLPGAPWQLGGKLAGTAEGRVTAKRFAATARVTVRDGRLVGRARDIEASGAEVELEFSDLWKLRTRSGSLRVGEFRVGRFAVRELAAAIRLQGARTISVEGATAQGLGGRLALDPFVYQLDQRDQTLTVRGSNLDPAQVLALAPRVTVRVPGRLAGTVPLRIDAGGVRLLPGFVAWQPNISRELTFNPGALLRSGATMDDATRMVLRAAGAEPVRLRLTDLRLDIRPPDVPLGSSAVIHLAGDIAGEPVAAAVPVQGSLERYIEVRRAGK